MGVTFDTFDVRNSSFVVIAGHTQDPGVLSGLTSPAIDYPVII